MRYLNEKLTDLFSKRAAQNIVSFMTGLGFFGVIFKFIYNYTNAGGEFLGFMFFPAIFCGAALVNIKLIRQNVDNKRNSAVAGILLLDIILIVTGTVFLADIFMNFAYAELFLNEIL